MKAVANSDNGSMYASLGVYSSSSSARITKHKRDMENEEIRVYLSKLKRLVPFMPKNRRLSKLEVIQYVIDYICDLQQALESHPTISSVAVHSATAAAVMISSAAAVSQAELLDGDSAAVAVHPRPPLTVLTTPNTNVHTNTSAATSNINSVTSVVGSATLEFAAICASNSSSSSSSSSSRSNNNGSSGGRAEKVDYSCESGVKSVAC